MKEYQNRVLSSEHTIATGDVFCNYLQTRMKKHNNMTPKAFKACFEACFKLYKNLKAEKELMIGKKEWNLIFFNSAEHHNMFVQQQ